MIVHKVEAEIAGRKLTIETGQMGRQARGAVVVRYADTVVFTAVAASEPPEGIDFFPLTVDYREKTYAAGKIPGGFFKREGRPSTKETLTMRLIDRPIRPLFPKHFVMDIAVTSIVLSADKENDPDILAVIGASAALAISDLPFAGPVGAVRVGLRPTGELIFNPTHTELQTSLLDLVVAGTKDAVTMVEAGAKEVSEETMVEALDQAHRLIREIAEMQEGLVRLVARAKIEVPPPEDHPALREALKAKAWGELKEATLVRGKLARRDALKKAVEKHVAESCPEGAEPPAQDPRHVREILDDLLREVERELILRGTRADGRGPEEIRDIHCEVGLLPRAHGSALFSRGETQALVAITLGTALDEQIIDGLLDEYRLTFMLHYNFPAFSVGETWPNRGPKRREIGHGALASRAIESVIPSQDEFPYTIRVVSDILESNGSSSMATVCGGTLALMDAGVQILRPVAGVAMGLVKEGAEVRILTDIMGSEDKHGDMDFKVAGTQRGITALQMDIKTAGIDRAVMARALDQARRARIEILRKMLETLPRPRPQRSPYAPTTVRFSINPEKIGLVIGPSGKMIKKIQEETKSTIDIEDSGTVTIWGATEECTNEARKRVELLAEEVRPGQIYEGRVVSVKDFGCFVEVLPGQEGLVHVSELDKKYVEKVGDVVKIGDKIRVKCLGVDNQGRVRLSKKAVDEEESGVPAATPPATDGGEPREFHRPREPREGREGREGRESREGHGDRGGRHGGRRRR